MTKKLKNEIKEEFNNFRKALDDWEKEFCNELSQLNNL